MNAMPQQTDLEDFTGTSVDLFSYAALSREDEMKVRGRVDRIRIRAEDALQAWCDIGHELKCLREEVPHGGFLSLVDQEFGWGKTQVNEFIQIYDHWAPKVRNSVPLEAPLSAGRYRGRPEEHASRSAVRCRGNARRRPEGNGGGRQAPQGRAKAADELAEARAKLESLQKLSEDKDFENAGEIHKLQIQIEALEKGRDLARKDANTAESKASAVEKEMDERISIAVSEAAQKIEAGFKDEIRRLQLENAELRKPKPVAIVEGHTAEIVPFARDLTDEESRDRCRA